MRKKLLLVEHWGACDKYGEPIGHTLKVMEEYSKLLESTFEISVAMPEHMINKTDSRVYDSIHTLPYAIRETQPKGLEEKIVDKLKVFSNIKQVRKLKKYDIVWYIRADFFLLLYMLLCTKRRKQKIYTLIYHNEYSCGLIGKIFCFIHQLAIKKFDGVIYTQKDMKISNDHIFYMPDYLYSEDKYEEYRNLKKEEKAVCLGTINSDKDIEGLVEAFNENGYSLEIAGGFLDEDRFLELKAKAKNNIKIENKILSYEEYYTRMGSAKYSIMPYKMEAYAGRTSGVLQESVFVGSIPVAPKLLLEKNNMPGYGYKDSVCELRKIIWSESENCDKKEQMNTMLLNYNQKVVSEKLINFLG